MEASASAKDAIIASLEARLQVLACGAVVAGRMIGQPTPTLSSRSQMVHCRPYLFR